MQLVEFDFNSKRERAIGLGDLQAKPPAGIFYWLIIDPGEEAQARELLNKMGAHPDCTENLLGPVREACYDLYDSAIHFSVSEAWLESGELRSGVLEFVLGPHYLALRRYGPSPVILQMLKIYRDDFRAFARTAGFLLFELASQLSDSYRRTYQGFANEVEKTQLMLFGEVSDEIFVRVSRLTADLMGFRRMVLVSRDLFKELATRKSSLVSESTQPSLDLHSGHMERIGDDLESERSVLAETLNLYMGMVSHRTNKVVNRLTILSMIFLPLGFFTGVFGMNFEHMQGLDWPHAYKAFWVLSAAFVVVLIFLFKRKKWI